MIHKVLISLSFVILVATSSAADAAGYHAQAIPGATCAPDNTLPAASIHEYKGRALVNTGSSAWDVFIAKCPISEFTRGMKGMEFRVVFSGEAEQPWCATYDAAGEEVDFGNATASGSYWIYFGPASPYRWQYNFTTYCLMQRGATLESIELIWKQE